MHLAFLDRVLDQKYIVGVFLGIVLALDEEELLFEKVPLPWLDVDFHLVWSEEGHVQQLIDSLVLLDL